MLCLFLLDSPPLVSCPSTTILWPVKRGANRISCQPLQKALQLKKPVQKVRWYKCSARCQANNANWTWVGGINSLWHVQTANDTKYHLDERGILQIRDMAEADNGTTYRCSVQPCLGCFTKSVFILLLLDPEEGKMINLNIDISDGLAGHISYVLLAV